MAKTDVESAFTILVFDVKSVFTISVLAKTNIVKALSTLVLAKTDVISTFNIRLAKTNVVKTLSTSFFFRIDL